ncbi:MAG: four helix bundle protein [Cardiobacteriales bacterium]|nr:MAG: four helix bundle protein [Cardiobacteriales bacterium]
MENNAIQSKSYHFAIRIVKLYKFLVSNKKEFVLSKQVLRSGTAIGALVSESKYAQSKADFVSKLSIALKEANETEYWLTLLKDTDFIDEKSFNSIISDNKELLKLLISIINSTKRNN